LKNLDFAVKITVAQCHQWQKAKIPPYKHVIAAYGATIAGLHSQIAYGGWQKICHAIPPWCCHLTTLRLQTFFKTMGVSVSILMRLWFSFTLSD